MPDTIPARSTAPSKGRRPPLRLCREGFPASPALDVAISRALLEGIGDPAAPETLRLYRPGPTLAFGPADRLRPGYAEAQRAAREQGFEPCERLVGGHAAVYHEQTVAFAVTVRDPNPRESIHARFAEVATLVAAALRTLGVDARVGPVPGEYCPGAYSVNAAGRTKLAGIGQRIGRQGAHVGGVVVVAGADRVRRALNPVYSALGLEWDERTAGSIRAELGSIPWDDAAAALVEAFAGPYDVYEAPLDATTMAKARALAGLDAPPPEERHP